MNLTIKKQKILTKLTTIGTTITLLAINGTNCFAAGIGTAEVETATENIKRVITSIAMPLGRCPYLRKCCNSCNKNDCQC